MNRPNAKITKHNKTMNKLMFPRKHEKALPKEDSQIFLKKAPLTEVTLEVLGPTECLLLVRKQTRLGT